MCHLPGWVAVVQWLGLRIAQTKVLRNSFCIGEIREMDSPKSLLNILKLFLVAPSPQEKQVIPGSAAG